MACERVLVSFNPRQPVARETRRTHHWTSRPTSMTLPRSVSSRAQGACPPFRVLKRGGIMRRRAIIGALLLIGVGVVLGATIFHTDIAQATGSMGHGHGGGDRRTRRFPPLD